MSKQYPNLESKNENLLQVNDFQALYEVQNQSFTWEKVAKLKQLTNLPDDTLADILGINVKTFRTYKQKNNIDFKNNFKEFVILLTGLFNHGISVFGSTDTLDKWLVSNNFYFNNKPPVSFLSTYSGLKYTDSRLSAIEFGDNA